MKEILNKIRSLRLSRGYTQEYMAEKLNLDAANYGRIERGQAKLTLDRFLKICEILEVEPSYFFEASYNQKVIDYLEKIYETEKQILNVLQTQKSIEL